MRKRPVLLLELVISLTLFATMMGILFSSYRELTLAKSSLHQEKESILNRQILQLRLSQIFSRVESMELKDGSWLLKYDNGADMDPAFRGVLTGMLTIDAGRLALASWPEKGRGRTEILYAKADHFYFEFFDAKKGVWSDKYPEDKPFMMKMKINNLELPFFL